MRENLYFLIICKACHEIIEDLPYKSLFKIYPFCFMYYNIDKRIGKKLLSPEILVFKVNIFLAHFILYFFLYNAPRVFYAQSFNSFFICFKKKVCCIVACSIQINLCLRRFIITY